MPGIFSIFKKKKSKAKKFKLPANQQALLDAQAKTGMAANAAALDFATGLKGGQQAAEDATYKQIYSRLQPDFDLQRRDLENKLWGQGIAPSTNGIGSPAWDEAIRRFEQDRNDAVTSAALQSVTAGQQSAANSAGVISSLNGTGAPSQLPLAIYQTNLSRPVTGGGLSPLAKSLFKLGSTAAGGWASGGFQW